MDKPHSPVIKQGASYPKEFREEAVRYWLSSGKKAKVVAQELGVSDWKGIAGIRRWNKATPFPLLQRANCPVSMLWS